MQTELWILNTRDNFSFHRFHLKIEQEKDQKDRQNQYFLNVLKIGKHMQYQDFLMYHLYLRSYEQNLLIALRIWIIPKISIRNLFL